MKNHSINYGLMIAHKTCTPVQQWQYAGSYTLRDPVNSTLPPHCDSDIGSYVAFDNIVTGQRGRAGWHWEEGIFIDVDGEIVGYVGTIDNGYMDYMDDVAEDANPGAPGVILVSVDELTPLADYAPTQSNPENRQ